MVRGEVSRQFAASLAAVRPLERVLFTTWYREVCRLALSHAYPSCRGPPPAPRVCGSHYLRKGGALIFPGSLNVIAFIGFGNQFYSLRCLLRCEKHGRENKPQVLVTPGPEGHVAEGEVPGLRCVLLGLSHFLGRDHCSWKQGAGMVCARGDPGIVVGESAWGFGTCPFVGWSPQNWPGMVIVIPSSTMSSCTSWLPLSAVGALRQPQAG